jgi:hypothetical protein
LIRNIPDTHIDSPLSLAMETDAPPENHSPARFTNASEYRSQFGRRLMVLTKLKGATPASDELCRIIAVEPISPSPWVTAQFLDGSSRGFRPEMIRRADDVEPNPVNPS